ncbi:MAG: BamA/TamA family outer membrane protein [Acidobacteria bacterium]|nr:BamA/TamA family outer membrane protein [Acidobacteriota bacterium]
MSAFERARFDRLSTPPPVGTASGTDLREIDLTAGVRLPFARIRGAQVWHAAFAFERHTFATPQSRVIHGRNALRLAWAFNSARQYGFSISPEQGVAIGLASEHVRRALGADGNADAFTAEFRAYPRLGGRHAIFSLRAGVGTGIGDPAVRRMFYLGRSNAAGSLVNFGSNALSMLRGFDDSAFAGRHIAVAGVEYRRPLFRIDRGPGWWPLMVRVLHGALFVDAGHVWNRRFSINDTKVSAGGEASVDLVAGYAQPLTVTLGGAWTRDDAGREQRSPSVYVRVGRAF